jgi:hypothetical protein
MDQNPTGGAGDEEASADQDQKAALTKRTRAVDPDPLILKQTPDAAQICSIPANCQLLRP